MRSHFTYLQDEKTALELALEQNNSISVGLLSEGSKVTTHTVTDNYNYYNYTHAQTVILRHEESYMDLHTNMYQVLILFVIIIGSSAMECMQRWRSCQSQRDDVMWG